MDKKIEKLNFLGQYLAASRSVEETLDMAMIISKDVLGYDHAMIRLLDGALLRAVKWIGFPREAADLQIHIGEGISGAVAQSGQAILVEDTLKDSRFLKGVENCRSELCAPMLYNDKVIGIFNVESEQPAFFTESDRNILETFAALIAASMESARLREKLSQAEKLSVIGSFASSILHDIRNDIHQLNICSDMLKSGGADPDRVALLAGVVKRSADNIYGLIEDIFDFVKSGHTHLRKERQPLEPLLEALAYQAKSIAPDNVETLLAAEAGLALSLDRRRLSRALFNLIKNAIEAMPQGGVVSLSARRAADGVEIEVADTGVGIEPERLERIWDQFYTHGKTQGTGLGMAIVKKIVEDHGWRVAARSTVGQGTAFTITAPAEE